MHTKLIGKLTETKAIPKHQDTRPASPDTVSQLLNSSPRVLALAQLKTVLNRHHEMDSYGRPTQTRVAPIANLVPTLPTRRDLDFGEAPLQAVWVEEGSEMRWDKPINGIQWFYDPRTNLYKYEVTSFGEEKDESNGKGPNNQYLAGQDIYRPYEDWLEANMIRAQEITERIENYDKLDKSRDSGTDRKDKNKVYVEDDLGKLDGEHKTHFDNTYSADGSQAIMRENYLYLSEDLKGSFFASDVFFSQLAHVNQKLGREHTPFIPPHEIIRDHVVNKDTIKVLQTVIPGSYASTTPQFSSIMRTPNGKTTFNIIDDLNALNRARDVHAPIYTITGLSVQHTGTNEDSGWSINLTID